MSKSVCDFYVCLRAVKNENKTNFYACATFCVYFSVNLDTIRLYYKRQHFDPTPLYSRCHVYEIYENYMNGIRNILNTCAAFTYCQIELTL